MMTPKYVGAWQAFFFFVVRVCYVSPRPCRTETAREAEKETDGVPFAIPKISGEDSLRKVISIVA